MLRAPSTMLITTMKNAPRKVTKTILISGVGQKMTATGTHASGGTGRMISNTG